MFGHASHCSTIDSQATTISLMGPCQVDHDQVEVPPNKETTLKSCHIGVNSIKIEK